MMIKQKIKEPGIRGKATNTTCSLGHKTYAVSLRLPVNQATRRIPWVFCPRCECFIRVDE